VEGKSAFSQEIYLTMQIWNFITIYIVRPGPQLCNPGDVEILIELIKEYSMMIIYLLNKFPGLPFIFYKY